MNHNTSSPHYPQSNGPAEKFVQIVRKLFYKVIEEGANLFKSLMIYHNTPLASNLQSPMQMLQNRTVRSQLPMSNAARNQLGLQTDGVTYRKTQSHLKPYGPQNKQDQNTTHKYNIWTLTNEHKKYTYNDNLAQSRTRRHIKPPVKLNL